MKNPQNREIRNIVFDMGGVLMGLDISKTVTELEALGISAPEENYFSSDEFVRFLIRFETGGFSAECFREKMRGLSSHSFSDEEFDRAWNAMLTGYETGTIAFLKELSLQYRLMLLSNTNPIHARYFENKLNQQAGIENIRSLFDKVYYSHQLGTRKPVRKIYEYLLTDSFSIPEETLFIDDNAENIESASQTGMQTHLFSAGENLRIVLQKYSIQ